MTLRLVPDICSNHKCELVWCCFFFLLSSFYLFDVLASYNIFIPVGRMCMLCMCLSYCCCCYVSFLCFWSVLKALFHIYLLRIKCDACYVLYRITSIACVLRQSEQVWFDAPALTQQEIIKFLCEDVVCYFFFVVVSRVFLCSISVDDFDIDVCAWNIGISATFYLSLPVCLDLLCFFFFFILDRWSVGWCGTRSVHLAKVLHMAYAVAVATFHIDNGPKWNGSLFINYLLYGLWNRH